MQYSDEELIVRQRFAKHYTPVVTGEDIARKILRHIDGVRPFVIDPACGSLNLLLAMRSVAPKNIKPKFLGLDLHPEVSGKEGIKVVKGNAFFDSKEFLGACDVIFTNPPFGRRGHPKLNPIAQKGMDKHLVYLFNRLGINKFKSLTTLEIAFISLGIQLLKKDGIGAIVLPESIFTCTSFNDFRQKFQREFKILDIIELPEKTFSSENAAVSTGVLVFKNSVPPSKYAYKFSSPKSETRMGSTESSYWYPWRDPSSLVPPNFLSSLNWKPLREAMPHLKIKSGFKGKQPVATNLQSETVAYYVTSKEIKNSAINLKNAICVPLSKDLARTIVNTNDVLLVRSGMGCLGRAAMVSHSKIPIVPRSEIYTITNFKSDHERELFLLSLKIGESESGQPWWVSQLGTGVGTPNLNMEEIWSIPVLDAPISVVRRIAKGRTQSGKGRRAA